MKSILRKQVAVGNHIVYSVTGLVTILLLALQPAQAQTGYLYIHTKAISEDVHQSFNFTVSKAGTTVSTFNLRDELLNIEPTDIGAGHGTGAGDMWVIAGATRGADGAVYHRAPNSTTWDKLNGQTGAFIDGADLGHFLMVDASGNAYVYDGNNYKKIYDQGSAGVKAVDIASNGSINAVTGYTAMVDANGRVWKYTGDYNNTRTWTDITPTNYSLSKFTKLDVNPTTKDVVLVDAVSAVTKVDANGGSLVYYGKPLLTSTAAGDVAVDDRGVVYSIARDVTGMDAVFRNAGTSSLTWKEEPQTGLHYVLTAGDASQVWVTKGITAVQSSSFANPSTIYTRTGDGSATWIDDERVQTTQSDNAIMIPVTAGTYTIRQGETTGWNLQKIDVYDSAAGSTTSVAGNSASIVVKAGQVAHVVFTNGMVLPNVLSAIAGATVTLTDFGSGAAGSKGGPLSGFTDFHYFSNAAMNTTPDGYYSLTQNSTGWENSGLTDHTGKPGGYFMMVNASYAPNVFYKQRVTGLVPGKLYMLSFWVANLSPSSPLLPDVLAGVADTSTGVIIGSLSTGLFTKDKVWHQHIFSFLALSASSDVFIQNFAVGGFGNDLAIDDIQLASASALLATSNLGFTTAKTQAGVQLNWNGSPQAQTSYFEVQQSTNGATWKTLSKLDAVESTSDQAYTYTDQQPAAGTSYYRLLEMDKAGAISYSEVKIISYTGLMAAGMSAYPNPFATTIQLQLQSSKTEMVTINMLTTSGQSVYNKSIQLSAGAHTVAIDGLAGMPKGLYFLQVNSNGNTVTERLVKQ